MKQRLISQRLVRGTAIATNELWDKRSPKPSLVSLGLPLDAGFSETALICIDTHWLSGWPKKSPNFVFTTEMVFPKSLKFMNSGSQDDIRIHPGSTKLEAFIMSARSAELPFRRGRSQKRPGSFHVPCFHLPFRPLQNEQISPVEDSPVKPTGEK